MFDNGTWYGMKDSSTANDRLKYDLNKIFNTKAKPIDWKSVVG